MDERLSQKFVFPGLVPGTQIHPLSVGDANWVAGTSPAKTRVMGRGS